MKQPVWLWPNLLSLDAPVVALVWQDFLHRCYPSVLHAPDRLVLGLTVWAIYLADRLIDAWHPYRQNRGLARCLLAAVLLADGVVALVWLRPAILENGLPVGAAVAIYLAAFAWRRKASLWKQPCAALLFTTGVFLVAWSGTADRWHLLGWPAIAFFALCLGNLTLTAYGWIWMPLLALLCALVGHSRWYAAIAISAAGLAAVDLAGRHLSREARGVLADTALLAPLLWR